MSASKKSASPESKRDGQFDSHHRFLIATALAVLTFLLVPKSLPLPTQFISAWEMFALTNIVLAAFVLSTKDPYEVRRNARLQDASRTFLFIVAVGAALVSVFAVFFVMDNSRSVSHERMAGKVLFSLAAIVLSWTLVHTLFSLHYAHLYYFDAHNVEREKIKGGLIFPEDDAPAFSDFVYFSFVIGMTCQVSDVQITSKRIRRHVIWHGVISFIFNTAILAMFVNMVAGLV
ncbi:MAG: hypothetical protein B9S32_06115 [Verrucomicrobia bacterium Tous-C9LFEB]|nr:MAG: hypothetical protein B9S32_06115 [Verrucomicrobia bacterium Tous-C9LFEB]